MKLQRNYSGFNILFWLVYFLYESVGVASASNEYHRYLIHSLAIVPITAAAGLFTVHVLIDKYLSKNRRRAFWVGLILSMIVFIMLRRSFNYYYTYPIYFPGWQECMSFFFAPKLIIEGVNIYLIVGLYTMFHFVRALYEQQRIAQMLQQDKLSSELELLKFQVQPHFIFNMLNNIYSLSLQKSENAPGLIHRLSSFLSYNLYDSKQQEIPVKRELEYIYNYIELEKIRYGNKLDIAVNVYQPLDGFEITPLLFLPLVENSFKHGIAAGNGKGWIRIDIMVQKDWLVLKIENSRPANPVPGEKKSGIGLENVRRRLEILYPGRHEFRCVQEEQTYLSILKIKKDS